METILEMRLIILKEHPSADPSNNDVANGINKQKYYQRYLRAAAEKKPESKPKL